MISIFFITKKSTMKKLFFAGVVTLSVLSLAIAGKQQSRANAASASFKSDYYQDTVPDKKKDTTKKPDTPFLKPPIHFQ